MPGIRQVGPFKWGEFSRCDAVLSLVFEACAPGVTRTPDPRIRNPLLYPAELRAQMLGKWHMLKDFGCAFHGAILRSAL
jgi:hypothetical protein